MRKHKQTRIPKAVILEDSQVVTVISRLANFLGLNFPGARREIIYSSPRIANQVMKKAIKDLKKNGARVVYKGKSNIG